VQPQLQRYFNRELSWLDFNRRVLEEVLDPTNPLLERVRFFGIVGSNLDEFFEIRVAGLKQQILSGVSRLEPDGMLPVDCLKEVRRRVRGMVREMDRCWLGELKPGLGERGIYFLERNQLTPEEWGWLEEFFQKHLLPRLSPLAVAPTHPWPLVTNKVVHILVHGRFPPLIGEGRKQRRLAVVPLPQDVPRLIQLPKESRGARFVFLGDVIRWFLDRLFFGVEILGAWCFRFTRNSELYLNETDLRDLLTQIEEGIRRRLKGAVVRVEVEAGAPDWVKKKLLQVAQIDPEDLYEVQGPLVPRDLECLCSDRKFRHLCFPSYAAPVVRPLRGKNDLFAAIRKQDILLHHPYENFESIIQLLQQAATDPHVVAIKQTLYRTGDDRQIPNALIEAALNGKQVTVVVELKARFDEERNIRWAKTLREAGAQVIFGLQGLKVHCKMLLIVRSESGQLRRYLHLGTGNYNPDTARLYADLGLLTCDPELADEAQYLFLVLTGLCRYRPTKALLVAPFDLHQRMLGLIDREIQNAQKGLPARIIAKMNALVESTIIDKLYEASQKGVSIDLIVRGICCLRPGVPGLSERIRVRSIIGRFLEHSRVFYFENGGQPELYIGSADWMPRNLYRRVETVFPIKDGRLRDRILKEVLQLQLADNTRARVLQPDGSYLRLRPQAGQPEIDCQKILMEKKIQELLHEERSKIDMENIGHRLVPKQEL